MTDHIPTGEPVREPKAIAAELRARFCSPIPIVDEAADALERSQPRLTDEMIETESAESRSAANWDEQKAFERGARWARDRMAQPEAPTCDHGKTARHACTIGWCPGPASLPASTSSEPWKMTDTQAKQLAEAVRVKYPKGGDSRGVVDELFSQAVRLGIVVPHLHRAERKRNERCLVRSTS